MDNIIRPAARHQDCRYVQEIRHEPMEPWHAYDVLLAVSGYGWDDMIDWADYVIGADLDRIGQVMTGSIGRDYEITGSFLQHGGTCRATPELQTEQGLLSVAGISRTLGFPVKIAWYNQTRVLTFFTVFHDEELMERYAETMVRRIFGEKNAMMLGKPSEDA